MSLPADSGSAGSGASTPWHAYDVSTIWSLVGNQDTTNLWNQLNGWKKTVELTSLHLYNLQQYREQLAEAWPPSRSQASQAYLGELDKLIQSVQETHDNANANYNAMVSIAGAASDAKYKIKPLFDEFQSNQRKLADYQQVVDSYNADTTGMPQPSPGPSPVPTGRQEELNRQARGIMSGVSSEINLAAASLRPPAPYKPPTPRRGTGDDSDAAGGGGGGAGPVLVPPTIPSVTPSQPGRTPIGVLNPSWQPAPGGQGPILNNVAPPLAPPPAPPLNPIGPPPPVTPGPGLPHVVPPVIGPPGGRFTRPPTTVIGAPTPAGLGPAKGGTGPRTMGLGGPGRPMPPGGVIGGTPGAGLGQPGGARMTARVNPPGGVIGQAAGGASGQRPMGGRPGAAAGSGSAGGLAAHSRPGQRRDDEPDTHWDPDNPWETGEGVAPVVLPPEAPGVHDPGPAIGRGR